MAPSDVILVGAVNPVLGDNRTGGQSFACRSLIESSLSSRFRFHFVDSSIRSIKDRPGIGRTPAALKRLTRFAWLLTRLRRPTCILFCSHGPSFLEKGTMTLLARSIGCHVLLLPRSGHLTGALKKNRLFRVWARIVLQHASVVVCQSDSWRSYFQELVGGRGNFVVVENWLAEGAFVAPHLAVAQSDGNGFVVGFYNRIERSKGIFDFLEAVRITSAKVVGLRALVYGDGNAVSEMNEWIREHGMEGIIEYRGWLEPDQKCSRLRSLDAYIFTSHVEGFPNSLLEALALKVPTVSVKVGAVQDVLQHGRSGLLTEVGDVSALSDAMIQLAASKSLRQQIAEGAYARIRERNSLDAAVRAFEAVLR